MTIHKPHDPARLCRAKVRIKGLSMPRWRRCRNWAIADGYCHHHASKQLRDAARATEEYEKMKRSMDP